MWIWLAACGEEVEGALVSSTGTPLASVAVRTDGVESLTASNGGFRAPPGASVSFGYGGVEYAAAEVRAEPYRLPPVRKVEVRCPPDDVCDLILDFGSHDGLSATVRHACAPGGAFPLDAPNHEPTAVCQGGRALFVDARRERIDLHPEGRPVEVRIEGADAAGCEAWVDAVPLKSVGGRYRGQARGLAWAGGRCAGRPLAPRALEPTASEVTLVLPPEGPSLRVADAAPWAVEVVISDPAGWSVNTRPVDGMFALPALPAGEYRLEIRGAHPAQGSATIWPPAQIDGITVLPGGTELWLGTWRVVAGAAGAVAVAQVR
jgi:hypothetical protein